MMPHIFLQNGAPGGLIGIVNCFRVPAKYSSNCLAVSFKMGSFELSMFCGDSLSCKMCVSLLSDETRVSFPMGVFITIFYLTT